MCGIVGLLLKHRAAAPLILEALRRVEYRGYDSCGEATLEGGCITLVRAAGKLINLEEKLKKTSLLGDTGIGHTRWATHGKATEMNAHPHATERIALVHNGIIEKSQQHRIELEAQGVKFATVDEDGKFVDTEVILHRIDLNLAKGMHPIEATQKALEGLEGAYAILAIFKGRNDLMIGARRGSPLVVGYGDGEMFLGSDAVALGNHTNRFTYLEEGDMAVVTRSGVTIYDHNNVKVTRPIEIVNAADLVHDKGHHRHFMAYEIFQQPEVVGRTFARYLDFENNRACLPEDFPVDFSEVDRVCFTACGTASYVGLEAIYWFERLAQMSVDWAIASEFRYREPPLSPKGITIVVSQSGETADTLAALRYAKSKGQKVLAIVNVPTSTIAREADYVLPILAGPEQAVASTKAFTCMLAVVLALAVAAGRARKVLSEESEAQIVQACNAVPRLMNEALEKAHEVDAIAQSLNGTQHAFFLGRGLSYPIAIEAALKLKECAYIHAEGQAAGELKHGSIALIDKKVLIIVIAPHDRWFEKTISNADEIAARAGKVILLTDEKGKASPSSMGSSTVLALPNMIEEISPIVFAVLVQLLAYFSAVYRGLDVDQPRNLAKSVTVE
jgi:glucosamine--fructose-6-phosphate aminotransferase (isomerizing)